MPCLPRQACWQRCLCWTCHLLTTCSALLLRHSRGLGGCSYGHLLPAAGAGCGLLLCCRRQRLCCYRKCYVYCTADALQQQAACRTSRIDLNLPHALLHLLQLLHLSHQQHNLLVHIY